jgi:hypothetical protein
MPSQEELLNSIRILEQKISSLESNPSFTTHIENLSGGGASQLHSLFTNTKAGLETYKNLLQTETIEETKLNGLAVTIEQMDTKIQVMTDNFILMQQKDVHSEEQLLEQVDKLLAETRKLLATRESSRVSVETLENATELEINLKRMHAGIKSRRLSSDELKTLTIRMYKLTDLYVLLKIEFRHAGRSDYA